MTVQAYVLIQTEVGKAAQVASEVRKIEGVKSADDVTGPYAPLGPIFPDLSFDDPGTLTNRAQSYYRLHQW